MRQIVEFPSLPTSKGKIALADFRFTFVLFFRMAGEKAIIIDFLRKVDSPAQEEDFLGDVADYLLSNEIFKIDDMVGLSVVDLTGSRSGGKTSFLKRALIEVNGAASSSAGGADSSTLSGALLKVRLD